MTELEIMNFANDFNNLIRKKDNEIAQLSSDNKRLRAAIAQLSESGKRLTEEEVREGQCPVYAFSLYMASRNTRRAIGWVVPLKDGIGVISNAKGVYRYFDYGRTWYALSARPED